MSHFYDGLGTDLASVKEAIAYHICRHGPINWSEFIQEVEKTKIAEKHRIEFELKEEEDIAKTHQIIEALEKSQAKYYIIYYRVFKNRYFYERVFGRYYPDHNFFTEYLKRNDEKGDYYPISIEINRINMCDAWPIMQRESNRLYMDEVYFHPEEARYTSTRDFPCQTKELDMVVNYHHAYPKHGTVVCGARDGYSVYPEESWFKSIYEFMLRNPRYIIDLSNCNQPDSFVERRFRQLVLDCDSYDGEYPLCRRCSECHNYVSNFSITMEGTCFACVKKQTTKQKYTSKKSTQLFQYLATMGAIAKTIQYENSNPIRLNH